MGCCKLDAIIKSWKVYCGDTIMVGKVVLFAATFVDTKHLMLCCKKLCKACLKLLQILIAMILIAVIVSNYVW